MREIRVLKRTFIMLLISEKIYMVHKRIFRRLFYGIRLNNRVLMRHRYLSRLTCYRSILLLSERGSYPPKWGQTLSRSYGRCIAEFLSEGSLVSLSLLDSSTCVGLRYGRL